MESGYLLTVSRIHFFLLLCISQSNSVDYKETLSSSILQANPFLNTSHHVTFEISKNPVIIWLLVTTLSLVFGGVIVTFAIMRRGQVISSSSDKGMFQIENFQRFSVFRLLLYKNLLANVIGYVTYLLQLTFLGMFYFYKFPLACFNNDKCEDRILSPFGWFVFVSILFIFVFRQLIDGILMLYEGAIFKHLKSCFAGFMVLHLSILTVVISAFGSYATASTNEDLFMNAVTILLLNEISKYLFTTIQHLSFVWIEDLEYNLENDSVNSSVVNEALSNMMRSSSSIHSQNSSDKKKMRRSCRVSFLQSSLHSSFGSSGSLSRGTRCTFEPQVLSNRVKELEKKVYQLKGQEMTPSQLFHASLQEDDIKEAMRQDEQQEEELKMASMRDRASKAEGELDIEKSEKELWSSFSFT